MKKKYEKNNVILSETKNLMRSFTFVVRYAHPLRDRLMASPAAQDDSEFGRSMVEMLGVLAIIGVLSVGGIAGYTSAMRSYRTNEILNATSILYVLAMAQNAGNGTRSSLSSHRCS